MFVHLAMAASQTTAPVPTPQLSNLAVARITGGACGGGGPSGISEHAAIRVSWVVTDFDIGLHTMRVYENNILKSSQSESQYDKTVFGSVEYGPFSQWRSDWTYRVDVVRIADGAVLASQQAAAWQQTYGACIDEDPE